MNNNLILKIGITLLVIIGIAGVLFFSTPMKKKASSNDGNTLSVSEAKTKIAKIIKTDLVKGGTKVKITKVTEVSGLYKVESSVAGQKGQDIYFTKDLKNFAPELINLQELKKQQEGAKKQAEEQSIVKNKTNKPKVELFVMSYCPYGTQFEKGYLPVVDKLKGKIDAKVKFVYYVMHGQKEADENVRQFCIEKNQPEKYNQYLSCFLEKGNTKDCQTRNKINKNMLSNCVATTNKTYSVNKNMADKANWLNGRFPKFDIHSDLNKKYGVQGSPTLVVNGQAISPSGRDSNSILKSICSAFKNPPAECKEIISSESPTPGFGYGKTADTQVQASCGA